MSLNAEPDTTVTKMANLSLNACSTQSSSEILASKPKRPLTSYVIYANEQREQLRNERPEETSAERMMRIGKMWSKLTDEEKRPYQAKARVREDLYRAHIIGQDLYREHLIKWSKDNGVPVTCTNTSSSSSSAGTPGKDPFQGSGPTVSDPSMSASIVSHNDNGSINVTSEADTPEAPASSTVYMSML